MKKITFKCSDNRFFIEINDIILNNMQNECRKAKNKETGGILIGRYSEDRTRAIVSSITGPPKDSEQGICAFYRGVNGLNRTLDDKWKLGHRYLGEWHFHPNSSPKPSIVDDIQMKKFANDKLLNCPEPILLIIGGNENKGWELSLHIYTKDSKLTLNDSSFYKTRC